MSEEKIDDKIDVEEICLVHRWKAVKLFGGPSEPDEWDTVCDDCGAVKQDD